MRNSIACACWGWICTCVVIDAFTESLCFPSGEPGIVLVLWSSGGCICTGVIECCMYVVFGWVCWGEGMRFVFVGKCGGRRELHET